MAHLSIEDNYKYRKDMFNKRINYEPIRYSDYSNELSYLEYMALYNTIKPYKYNAKFMISTILHKDDALSDLEYEYLMGAMFATVKVTPSQRVEISYRKNNTIYDNLLHRFFMFEKGSYICGASKNRAKIKVNNILYNYYMSYLGYDFVYGGWRTKADGFRIRSIQRMIAYLDNIRCSFSVNGKRPILTIISPYRQGLQDLADALHRYDDRKKINPTNGTERNTWVLKIRGKRLKNFLKDVLKKSNNEYVYIVSDTFRERAQIALNKLR